MDWIQWYALAWLIIGCVSNMIVHDMPKARHDFRIYFVCLLLAIPTYGRIFGWW